MDLENLNFKAKDLISFAVYIISLSVYFLSMNAKVDRVTEAVDELKTEKREVSSESKASSFITQNDIKALTIRAELNRQNIEIIKSDIEMLKMHYNNRNN